MNGRLATQEQYGRLEILVNGTWVRRGAGTAKLSGSDPTRTQQSASTGRHSHAPC